MTETAPHSMTLDGLPTCRDADWCSRSVPDQNGKCPTRQQVNLHQFGTAEVLPSHAVVPGRARSPVAPAQFSAAGAAAASSVTGGGLGGAPAGVCAAAAYIRERLSAGVDARRILKGLVEHHDASLSYPAYRTALRIGAIRTEAASCCDLMTAGLLLDGFLEKASRL